MSSPDTAKAAHRGDGGDLRNSQSGRADGSENRRSGDQTQQLPDRQTRWLTRRFLISAPLAWAIAPARVPGARMKHAPPSTMADCTGEDDLEFFTARPDVDSRVRLPFENEFGPELLRPGAFVHVLLIRDPLTNEPRTRARAIFYSDIDGGHA
jgi:hypothetical protein